MAMNMLLVEEAQIVAGIIPVDLGTAANNGDYVSLKNFHNLTVIVFKGAGTAGDDPVITLQQAQDVSGTGVKELNFTRVDAKVGVQTATGAFTTVTQAAGNTYTDLVSAEAQGLFAIEVTHDMLDIANNFDCVRVTIPDTGTNAQVGCALYILRNPRYKPTGAISGIID